MGETTPDIRQLSMCCGKVLVWRDYVTFDGRYSADCSGCGADLCVEAMEQARELTATEKLLLARIAELEAAQRWRVTAEYSPHEGDRVLGLRGGEPEVMTYGEEGLDHPYLWSTADYSGVDAPGYWMPIPAVPVALSQGADVPNGEQNAR